MNPQITLSLVAVPRGWQIKRKKPKKIAV